MAKLNKSIVKELDSFVDWNALFPRSGRPDLRHNKISGYKAKKIREAMRTVETYGRDNFLKMKKSKLRSDVLAQQNQESFLRGVFVPSPAHTEIKRNWKGEVVLSVGGLDSYTYYFKRPITSENLKSEIDKAVASVPAGFDIIGIINGDNRFGYVALDELDLFKSHAQQIYDKYATLSDAGENRPDSNKKATHPSEWFIGLIFSKVNN